METESDPNIPVVDSNSPTIGAPNLYGFIDLLSEYKKCRLDLGLSVYVPYLPQNQLHIIEIEAALCKTTGGQGAL